MSHSAVPTIPEVTGASRNIAGHTEVVLETSKVGLSRHADAEVVCDVVGLVSGAAIVTVRFVVSGSNHVGARCSDGHHFVVKVVQDGLVHLVSFLDGGVGEESLDLLLQPVVGVGNVSNVPQELVLWHAADERINGVLLTWLENVVAGNTLASGRGQSLRAHGSQVRDNGDRERRLVTNSSAGSEIERLIAGIFVQLRRQVIVCSVRLQALNQHVVVVSRGCGIRDRHSRRCNVSEVLLRLAPEYTRTRNMFKRIPADHHSIVSVESDPNLGVGSIAFCSHQGKQCCQGSAFLHLVKSADIRNLVGQVTLLLKAPTLVYICPFSTRLGCALSTICNSFNAAEGPKIHVNST